MLGRLGKKKEKNSLNLRRPGGVRRPGCRRTNIQIIGPICLLLVLDVLGTLMALVYELSILLW